MRDYYSPVSTLNVINNQQKIYRANTIKSMKFNRFVLAPVDSLIVQPRNRTKLPNCKTAELSSPLIRREKLRLPGSPKDRTMRNNTVILKIRVHCPVK